MFFNTILLQAASGSSSPWPNILLIALFIGVFYFFMIRPQQRKQKKQKLFINNLKKGDAVVTMGGMHGKISEIENDDIFVEISRGVKVKFNKSAISSENSAILTKPTQPKS